MSRFLIACLIILSVFVSGAIGEVLKRTDMHVTYMYLFHDEQGRPCVGAKMKRPNGELYAYWFPADGEPLTDYMFALLKRANENAAGGVHVIFENDSEQLTHRGRLFRRLLEIEVYGPPK